MKGDIQNAYALRELYEQFGDPMYTYKRAITLIQKWLELAEAS